MCPEINELLTALNIIAEPTKTKYVLQIQYDFFTQRKQMLPKTKMLKFYNNKLINKVTIFGKIQTINYISQEMKLYKA